MAKGFASPSIDERQGVLAAERRLKMARSAHAYVRGATQKFYEWLDAASRRGLPEGPPVWICGDCHLGNLGPVASAKGRVDIQIRDLDQTVIGNPAHDLIRLGLSLATAARGSDLPGVTTAHMLEAMMAGYHQALSDGGEEAGEAAAQAHRPKSIKAVLARAVGRRWRNLASERIADARPSIPLGKRFWKLHGDEAEQITALFTTPGVRGMVTALRSRDDGDRVEVLDAAYWMKGCSSLGRLRYAVLVGVGDHRNAESGHCLVDIKEAVQPAAPRASGSDMPRGNAERVVAGAKALSPYLGERMIPARLNERGVVVRELLPQDLKLEIDSLTREEAMLAARYLGAVVGKAHGRQMDGATKGAWQGEIGRRWPKGLDAPFWLWSSVVDLVGSHEAAYLEHCRRYALGAEAA
ncbi:MAG: DUF2252 family protein [Caulobacteraceae bacterium]